MAGTTASVKEYLESLPEERRKAILKVRAAVNKGLPKGYKEGIQYGMIGWCVPQSLFPKGYHCDPKQGVPFAGLANQKNYMSLYLMGVYGDSAHRKWFEAEWRKTGKKLDMGKACIRFRNVEDIPLDLVTEAVARVPVEKFLAHYETTLAAGGKGKKRAAAPGRGT